MRPVSTLFAVLAILFASSVVRSEASVAPGGSGVRAVHAAQDSAAPLVPAAEPVKIGCKRGLPGVTPAPCSAGFAMLTAVPCAWSVSESAGVDQTWARWLKPFRPKGLLDPPRSA